MSQQQIREVLTRMANMHMGGAVVGAGANVGAGKRKAPKRRAAKRGRGAIVGAALVGGCPPYGNMPYGYPVMGRGDDIDMLGGARRCVKHYAVGDLTLRGTKATRRSCSQFDEVKEKKPKKKLSLYNKYMKQLMTYMSDELGREVSLAEASAHQRKKRLYRDWLKTEHPRAYQQYMAKYGPERMPGRYSSVGEERVDEPQTWGSLKGTGRRRRY